MNPSVSLLRQLLALLRGQLTIYQDAHWEVTGPQFYADHLLFERLYKSVDSEIDTLAEKMVSLFGPAAVEALALARLTTAWVARWSSIPELHQRGLKSEEDFEAMVEKVYEQLDTADLLSMGMDDFLMAAVNSHESNRYLLQQTQRT